MTAMTTSGWTMPAAVDGWTVDDLALLPDDLRHVELVEGTFRVSPSAPFRHNMIATSLASMIRAALDPGWVVAAPGGVQLDRWNVREPDVLVARQADTYPEKIPAADVLLAVEVMSPSSVTEDRLVKPAHYARAGIPHYWRIEPVERLLFTYALDGEVYTETGRYDDQVDVTDPVVLTFALADLLGS